MIGNQKASDAFNREFSGAIFRYVSGRDPVPKLPGLSLVANEFTHVESARVLGTDPMTNLSEFIGAIGAQAVKGVLAGSLTTMSGNISTTRSRLTFWMPTMAC